MGDSQIRKKLFLKSVNRKGLGIQSRHRNLLGGGEVRDWGGYQGVDFITCGFLV